MSTLASELRSNTEKAISSKPKAESLYKDFLAESKIIAKGITEELPSFMKTVADDGSSSVFLDTWREIDNAYSGNKLSIYRMRRDVKKPPVHHKDNSIWSYEINVYMARKYLEGVNRFVVLWALKKGLRVLYHKYCLCRPSFCNQSRYKLASYTIGRNYGYCSLIEIHW